MKIRGASVIAGFALMATSGMSVLAGDEPATMKEWIAGTGKAIDLVMYYPAKAMKKGHEGSATLLVTVDRAGEVKSYQLIDSSGRQLLDSAARRVVANTDFPALPGNYDSEEMSFDLVLNYKIQNRASKWKQRALVNGQKIQTERIADDKQQRTAGIRIHSATGS